MLLLSPEDLRDFARNVIATFGAISNIVLWRDSISYFALNVEHLPLLHTWSLSVEEQFYLVCPAVLVILARLRKGRATFMVALAAAISFSGCRTAHGFGEDIEQAGHEIQKGTE